MQPPGALSGPSGAKPIAVPLPAPLADGYTYPFPFSRYEVFTDYKSPPYLQEGKLFFQDPTTGLGYYCTAQVVNAVNLSTVWTAGHCVNKGGNQGSPGTWFTQHLFVPADKDGLAPLAWWHPRQLFSLNAWVNNGEYEYDLGAVVVAPNVSGLHVQDVTGAQAIGSNYPRIRHWHAFGYPSDPSPPFDPNGGRLVLCTASFAVNDSPDNPSAPPTIGIGCDMGHGASGGCWLAGFSAPGGECNSVNSYKYTNPPQPGANYGPYQGSAAQDMYQVAGTTDAGPISP